MNIQCGGNYGVSGYNSVGSWGMPVSSEESHHHHAQDHYDHDEDDGDSDGGQKSALMSSIYQQGVAVGEAQEFGKVQQAGLFNQQGGGAQANSGSSGGGSGSSLIGTVANVAADFLAG